MPFCINTTHHPMRLWMALITVLTTILGPIGGMAQETAATTPAATRAAFLHLIDRPRVPLEPTVSPLPDTEGLTHEHFSFATEQGERVPGILLKQKNGGRRPVVIVMAGTGGTKEGLLPILKTLAGRGFVAVSIDGRFHGERQTATGATQYVAAMLQTYRTGTGHPFLYDTVWDLMRLIDYLQTRPDVDAARLGMTGISKGGMETYLAAAVDPRIAVAVPMIGVQSFRWALDNQLWMSRVGTFQAAVEGAANDAGVTTIDAAFVRTFYDRVAPGIYGQFDGPAMLPLIAPRPLLLINGDSDARTPLPGLMTCVAAAETAYRAANAADKLTLYLQKNTGHTVTPPALQTAVDWFVTWLKP